MRISIPIYFPFAHSFNRKCKENAPLFIFTTMPHAHTHTGTERERETRHKRERESCLLAFFFSSERKENEANLRWDVRRTQQKKRLKICIFKYHQNPIYKVYYYRTGYLQKNPSTRIFFPFQDKESRKVKWREPCPPFVSRVYQTKKEKEKECHLCWRKR